MSSGPRSCRGSAPEHELVAVSRTARRAEPGIRWVEGDAASADDVARAVDGAEVVYYLVHSLGSRDFERQDRVAAQNVADASERAGVGQIVYLGGLGDDSPTASSHLRSRRETGERLASGSTPVTTLRAAMVVGKGSAAFETIVALVDRLPAMITRAGSRRRLSRSRSTTSPATSRAFAGTRPHSAEASTSAGLR